ncbi:MAG: hypothetical protein OQK55_11495, partial [Thermoanaerobaculales bacterium]|nr:hypothetical protein [Thermoanaerobaculales bacterium]
MRRAWIAATLFGVLWLVCGSASADIAFPARLDVTEREPGVYDISFTLPIIEGRKLRAEPRMPPTCVESSPREVGMSSGGLTSTWSVRCEPSSLAGEAILVEGLLGTQTDLAFTLTMLDGAAGGGGGGGRSGGGGNWNQGGGGSSGGGNDWGQGGGSSGGSGGSNFSDDLDDDIP